MVPRVEAMNGEEVYEYYGSRGVHQPLARAVHVASALIFHPHVTCASGAEERIAEHVNDGGRVILTSNHINMFDQLPIAAHMQHSDALRPMVGNTVAWAKQPYFTKWWLRPWLDAVGGMPVWRPQDMPRYLPRQEKIVLGRGLVNATAQRMADGAHLLLFPEGTRNRGDLTRLGKIQPGVGRLAVTAAERIRDVEGHNLTKVMVVPTALWYGDNKPKGSFDPYVHVHAPILVTPRTMPRMIVRRLEDATTDSLRHARSQSALANR